MTHHITIPLIGAADEWRKAARGCLAAGIPPDQVVWGEADTGRGLFDTPPPPLTLPMTAAQMTVPRSFIQMANAVVWHRDPERFARLYALLWRVQRSPALMGDRADPALNHLRRLEKNVHRCKHKMKAFVRFREVGDPTAPRRAFAAWFEPTHYTLEPTADFFVRRFADMDWQIATPEVTATFAGGSLMLGAGQAKPNLPEDAHEDLWITYFRNIFNPARLKISAMQSEMPKKYWRNLPEAAEIRDLIDTAPARARAMALAAPTLPAPHAARVQAQAAAHASAWVGSGDELAAAVSACTRCALHCHATQAVMGEGPRDARLMIVGEQPGDHEDLAGRPFVGPAGQLFDQIARAVGMDRGQIYLTNAVKHFKYTARGRKRIHQRPTQAEVDHCRPWLMAEQQMVRPQLTLAMGATASAALTGSGKGLATRRGTVEQTASGDVLITYHPAYLLRIADPALKMRCGQEFAQDLRLAWQRTAPQMTG